jgi:hypothetical protein
MHQAVVSLVATKLELLPPLGVVLARSLKPQSLIWRSGQWKESYEDESLNRREFENIVIALEEYYSKTGIHDVEFFMFTEKMVSDNAFYRGTSSSPILFELVLRLRLLEMHGDWKLHVIHISGKPMIQQGTDYCLG